MSQEVAFTVNHSPRGIFGIGSHQKTGNVLMEYGCKKVLAVYDAVIGSLGIADKVIDNIEKAGIHVVRFGDVAAEPDSASVNIIGELGRREGVDGVVGIGGGSSLDSAKGANLMLSNPGPLEDYIGANRGKKPIIKKYPLVLLPTTSGTSAEITPVFVVTETATGKKTGASNRGDIAIVDPIFMENLPAKITASTGVDMLAHVTESLINPLPHWVTEMMDEEVIRMTFRYLPVAFHDGHNMEARSRLAYACMLAGYAMADKGTYLGHAIVDRITNKVHCPHGQACAAGVLVAVRYAALTCPEKLRPAARAIGISDSLSDEELGCEVYAAYRNLAAELNQKTLHDFGLDETYIQEMCRNLPEDVRWKRAPMPEMANTLRAIREEYEGKSVID